MHIGPAQMLICGNCFGSTLFAQACFVPIFRVINTVFFFAINVVKTGSSQAEAKKPGLQHKFGNSTLFSPQTCSDDIKWAGPQHFL